jgi:hypothetical protein
MLTVRAASAAVAQDANAVQHGTSVAPLVLLPFECDDPGAQSVCFDVADAVPPPAATHADAVPATMN